MTYFSKLFIFQKGKLENKPTLIVIKTYQLNENTFKNGYININKKTLVKFLPNDYQAM